MVVSEWRAEFPRTNDSESPRTFHRIRTRKRDSSDGFIFRSRLSFGTIALSGPGACHRRSGAEAPSIRKHCSPARKHIARRQSLAPSTPGRAPICSAEQPRPARAKGATASRGKDVGTMAVATNAHPTIHGSSRRVLRDGNQRSTPANSTRPAVAQNDVRATAASPAVARNTALMPTQAVHAVTRRHASYPSRRAARCRSIERPSPGRRRQTDH